MLLQHILNSLVVLQHIVNVVTERNKTQKHFNVIRFSSNPRNHANRDKLISEFSTSLKHTLTYST